MYREVSQVEQPGTFPVLPNEDTALFVSVSVSYSFLGASFNSGAFGCGG